MSALVARARASPVLSGLLLAAVLYRALSYLAEGPLLMPSDDSLRYAHGGVVSLFSDPFAPSGYPLLLAAIHHLTGAAVAVSLVQHLLGLATAALILLIGLRLQRSTGMPIYLAAAPAVFVAFSGDQLFYEQSLMTETLFTFLVVAAIYSLLRAEGDFRWLLVAGACLAAASVTRTVGFPLIALCVLWLAFDRARPWRRRGLPIVAFAAGCGLVVGGYLIAAAGKQSGIGSFTGWDLYGRVAPFADCRQFTPPRGTAGLCESSSPSTRPGIYFYHFAPASPALRLFHVEPRGNSQLRSWAIAAIEGQPGAYIKTVGKDLFRYIDPGFGFHRPQAGAGPEEVDLYAPLGEYPPREQVEQLYHYETHRGPLFTTYESWLTLSRIPGLLWLAAIAASVAALVTARAGRRSLALIAGVAGLLALTPVLTVSYEYRFWLPGEGLLLVAAVTSAWAVFTRRRADRTQAVA